MRKLKWDLSSVREIALLESTDRTHNYKSVGLWLPHHSYGAGPYASIIQQAEITDLKSVKCEFKSRLRHQ